MARELRILIDEFDLLEMPLLLLGIPFLIDPLGDGSQQIVFVAIQRQDFTNYHGIALRDDSRTYEPLNIAAMSSGIHIKLLLKVVNAFIIFMEGNNDVKTHIPGCR